jgi:hypothetical protein
MSKQLGDVFKDVKSQEQQIGAVEAAKEGIQAVAPGLSLKKIFGDIRHELKEQVKHGAHELASALFTGQAYVQYARKDKAEDQEKSFTQQIQEEREQSRGGMER